jgi:hypothetical protein
MTKVEIIIAVLAICATIAYIGHGIERRLIQIIRALGKNPNDP